MNLAILFDIEKLKAKIKHNEEIMSSPSFWDEAKKAQSVINENNTLNDLLKGYTKLNKDLNDELNTINELNKIYDEDLKELAEEEYLETIKDFDKYEIKVLLKEDYDHSNAIIEFHPGAGGTESQDWAFMLYEMYRKWAVSNGYSVEILDYQEAIDAGIKSVSMLVKGDLAYGYLKGEKGVHRLVRISPFDSSGRRHTSFASVDVMPEFNDEIEIDIKENDLEIETHRASGAGGQHVNKTDSAIRIVHIPTGIVVTCQSERSQIQNKERAINMLKSKLYQKMVEDKIKKMNEIKGEQKLIEWGSQIRSYVFCPYTMVKDHRTNYSETNIDKVMNGEINNFIFSYLKSQI